MPAPDAHRLKPLRLWPDHQNWGRHMHHLYFALLGSLVGYVTYKLCRDPSTRREQFTTLGSTSRWFAVTLALLVFSIFALAPTLSKYLR